MFELPTFGQAVQLIFLLTMIYWAIKAIHEASEEKKQHDKEIHCSAYLIHTAIYCLWTDKQRR